MQIDVSPSTGKLHNAQTGLFLQERRNRDDVVGVGSDVALEFDVAVLEVGLSHFENRGRRHSRHSRVTSIVPRLFFSGSFQRARAEMHLFTSVLLVRSPSLEDNKIKILVLNLNLSPVFLSSQKLHEYQPKFI